MNRLLLVGLMFALSGCSSDIENLVRGGANALTASTSSPSIGGNSGSSLQYKNIVQMGETAKTTFGNTTAVDSSGNFFVAGDTRGNLLSCLGLSSLCSGNSNGSRDLYVSKYNSSGAWQWAQQLGALTGDYNSIQYVSGIATDAAGDVYIVGTTRADLTSCSGQSFLCQPTNNLLYPDGYDSFFLIKYSSSGVWQWTQQLRAYETFGVGIAIDSFGSIYVAGYAEGNIASCVGQQSNCAGFGQGSFDYFISKYDSSGSHLWTIQLGQTGASTYAQSIAVDSLSNVYITGYTDGNIESCGGVSGACSGWSTGTYDSFISKYDGNGNWQWTKQLGQAGHDTSAYSIAVDTNSNVYIVGQTDGNIASCGGVSGACSGAANGSWDLFIMKYISSGAWQWTKQLGASGGNSANSIVVDGLSALYITGYTDGNLVSCNGNSSLCSGAAYGLNDFFILKYDLSGNYEKGIQLGVSGSDSWANSIALDSSGNLVVAGQTSANLLSCNGVAANCSGVSQGNSDYFVSIYQK